MRAPVRLSVWVVGCLLVCLGVNAQSDSAVAAPHPSSHLSFIKNNGQWNQSFRYKADVPNGNVFLENNGLTYQFIAEESALALQTQMHRHFASESKEPVVARFHAFRMTFKNSNENAEIIASEKDQTYHNYYIGDDPSLWKCGVPLYHKIVYRNIYSHIDYEIFTANRSLKYNFIVAPAQSIAPIVMHYEGCALKTDNGKLIITTSVNEIVEQQPYAYQRINGTIVEVPCMFVVNGNDVSFRTGTYNTAYPLVIDPVVVFATYSGSTADNFGFTAAFDSEGDMYSAGITEANGYPTTTGAFQDTFQGGVGGKGVQGTVNYRGWDITISKYSKDGSILKYATYLGGRNNEYPHSLLVDYSDNLVVLGTTYSSNFPHAANAYDGVLNDAGNQDNTDIILTKFDPGGKFLAGTYIGGSLNDGINAAGLSYNYADEFRGDIIADKSNNYYIGSVTQSADFPALNALQGNMKGVYDGVVVKIDSGLSKIFWSTFWGGTNVDGIYSIDLDKQSNVYVSGGTLSTDFSTSTGAHQTTSGGGTDGFISKFSNDGKKMLASTYIGTSRYDQTYFIEIDKKGQVFAMGQTEGHMPVSGSVYSNKDGGQYIVKLDSTLSSLLLSTVFGTGRGGGTPDPDISPTAFLVDNCDLVYIAGWGSDITYGNKHSGSTNGMPIVTTPYPPKYATTDGNDFYLIVFEPNLTGLRYTTFFGGSASEDHVDGGTSRFDKRGIIYEAVCASCPSSPTPINDFPTEPKTTVKFPNNVSPRCSNAAFKIDFQLQTAIIADFRVTPRVACAPQVFSMNSKSKAVRYYWDFGDGATDTSANPQHAYAKPGTYKIQLVCFDTNTCNLYDTAFDEVTLLSSAKADFTYDIQYCENRVTFTNISTNQINFIWDFGDGTFDSVNMKPVHVYAKAGKYTVRLLVNRNFSCADSIDKPVDLEQYTPIPIVVPNVFTPNGDNINDVFEVKGIDPKCDKFEMRIYNRWGEKVFETKDAGYWWNGKNNHLPMPEGIYYYTLKVEDYKGKVTNRKGEVTIIR